MTNTGPRSSAETAKERDLAAGRASALWPRAVEFVRGELREDVHTVRRLHALDPAAWWVRFHFTGGMALRNALRRNGFGEEELGVDNLDNVYIELIEEACEC